MKKIVLSIGIILGFFTLSGQNTAPEVSGIPDQSLAACGTFVTINLDLYVTDAETAVADIVWTYGGNSDLSVSIINRVATISTPASNWYGSETITFTATDDDATEPMFDSDAASFTLAQMGIPSVGTITSPDCGETTGSVVLNNLPGTGTWTLTRNPGGVTSNGTGTGATLTGVPPGSYTWTVTSATGCLSESSGPALIAAPPLTPTAPVVGLITDPNCSVSTGSVALSGLPSSGSWTITASPGGATTPGSGATTTISGLAAGTHTFTVSNVDGCISVSSANVVIATPLAIPSAPLVGAITQTSCSLGTGSVVLSGLPASGSWTLTASPGGATTPGSGTEITVSGISPGTYTYTVTNADGCNSTASGSVAINAQPLTPNAPVVGLITDPDCSVSTGSVALSGLPSSGSWTITASPGGATTPGSGLATTISGLTAGTYTFTVTNADACISVASADVLIIPPLAVPSAPLVGAITQTSCSVGTGSVVLSGLPVAGSWTLTASPGGATTPGSGTETTVSGIAPGSYTYTVTNADGCNSTASGSVVINAQPLTPTAPVLGLITQPDCGIATGSVVLSGLPASGTWTVTANPGGAIISDVGTSTTFAGLSNGSYTFTVINEDGCISGSSAPVVIDAQPPIPTAPVTGAITQPTCAVGTGSVALSGLPASGSWTLTATPGGVTTPGSGTEATVSGINPGSYTYTVTNADGCISTASGSVVINTQPVTPTAPTIGLITQPTCSLATGSVVINGLPGSGNWTLTELPGGATYSGSGLSTTISGLSPDTYTYTVSNADGCISTVSGQVLINIQPLTPTAPLLGALTQTTCATATGSVVLNGLPASGSWILTASPGGATTPGTGNTTTISGLPSGTHSFTVSNTDGCSSLASADVVINIQPITPTAPVLGLITQPTCATATGRVVLNGLPGTGSWTVTTSPGGATSTNTGVSTNITDLATDTYTFTVTNADGCISDASAPVLIDPQPITPDIPQSGLISQPTCELATGGVVIDNLPATGTWTLTASPGGATTPGTGSSISISGLASGSHTFTVSNEDACTSAASDPVLIDPQPLTPSAPVAGLIIQPTCDEATGSVALGGLPAVGDWTLTRTPGAVDTPGNSATTTISGLLTGSYTYTVTNADGCTSDVSTSIVIDDQPITPAAPVPGVITQATCGLATGSVVINGLPASGSWTLTQFPGGTSTGGSGASTTITGLISGSYTYTVSNADGCTSLVSTEVVILPQPVTPTAPVPGLIIQASCSLATGSVTLNGLPSTGGWTLTRSPGGETNSGTGNSYTISGLSEGAYTFTVSNDDGCTSVASASVVFDPQPVTPSAPLTGTITQPTCGVATGSVVLNGLPAAGSWTLIRNPGGAESSGSGTGTTISGLGSGTYTYSVRNTEGCTSAASASIVINPQPVTPGAPQPGIITQPTCDVATGGVVLNGLPSSGSWTLTRYPGGATSSGSGSSNSIYGLSSGTYTYTVTNTDGCTSVGSSSVIIATQPVTPGTPQVGTVTHPTCGDPTGSVLLSGLPASGTWTLSWMPGGGSRTGTDIAHTITGLTSDNYTFAVTNDQGCTSSETGSVAINPQPVTPSAPQLGTITQPSCSVSTGSVVLNGLPASGSWVLTRYPGGSTTSGSGTGITISGLNPDAYTFTITNSVGCTSTGSSSLVINLQPPTPSAPVVGTITQPTCYSSTGSVVLSGLPESGTWTLVRNPGGSSRTGTGTVTSVSGLSAGNYTFIVRNSQGCPSVSSEQVWVNSQPTTPTSGIILGDNYTSCQGERVSLDAGAGFDSYSWSTGASSRTISVESNGNYSVTVTEGDCSASESANVDFNPIPSINLGPTINACVGESVTLDAGAGFDSYRWTTGANSRTINVSQNGTYGVTVEQLNCSNADDVQVVFNSLPTIPLATSYYGTSCINLDANNAGSTYQWNTGASTQSISACSSGTYSVIVTNPNQCSASRQTLVTIGEKPVVTLPESLEGCAGESIELDAGSGFSSYQWSTGATSQTIYVNSSGTYSVTVTDSHGEQASDNVPVTIHPLPDVDLGSDQSICQSESLELDAGSGFSSYAWSTGEATQLINVTTAGDYTVTVNDGNCSASDLVNVQVRSEPAVDLGPDRFSCVGETEVLDAGAGFANYNWSTGETSSSIEVSTPGTYSVSVTDNGCSVIEDIEVMFNILPEVELGIPISACEGDEVELNAGSGFSAYLWNTGETTQSILVSGSDNYTVMVSNGNCSSSDTLEATFHSAPQPNLGPAVTSCEGELPVLDAGLGFEGYLWNTGATGQTITVSTAGSYSVTVSDGTCAGSDDVDVSFLEMPMVDLGPSRSPCEGDEVILDAGPGYDIYLWSTGEKTQTISVTQTGEYLVSVNNRCGSTSDGVLVTMKVQPDVDLGEDISIEVGQEITLDAGSGQRAYLWQNGSTSRAISISWSDDGEYKCWVEVTGQNNCQNSDTIMVKVGEGTGIGESFLSRNINMYPNPAEDFVFVSTDIDFSSEMIVTVYDATGKMLLKEKWEHLGQGHSRQLDISDFEPGIFIISFYSDKELAIRKLIKHD